MRLGLIELRTNTRKREGLGSNKRSWKMRENRL